MATSHLSQKSGRLHTARWVLSAVVLGVGATVGLHVVGTNRHEALVRAERRAVAAIAQARAEEASVWAPEELLAAEISLRTAWATLRVEQTRWWPLPDERRVNAALAGVEAQAALAASVAADRRLAAGQDARGAIDEAALSVAASAEAADTIHVGTDRRVVLARARSALEEARVYYRARDFSTAALRARRATDLARQVRDHAAGVAARYSDDETVARWQRWKQETIEWSRRVKRAAIVVSKAEHTLTLFVGGRMVRTYRADMGFNWVSDKSHAGDGATPEGRYRVVARKANGASIYYKALLLDYPNAEDRAQFSQARRNGELPPSAAIGGLIEIHGEGGRGRDWTRGCVAITNAEMDHLFKYADTGTPVTIVGSDTHGSFAELGARSPDRGAGR